MQIALAKQTRTSTAIKLNEKPKSEVGMDITENGKSVLISLRETVWGCNLQSSLPVRNVCSPQI